MRNHRIEMPDGRRVAVDDHGPVGASTVVFAHIAPGSRLLDPDPAATATAGVRLLAVDRPGYGASTPFDTGVIPTIPTMADDLASAVNYLGVEDVAAIGWSAGGRIALALAARHPDLVRSVAVVGTPAPDDEVPWIPAEYRAVLDAMRTDPAAGRAQLEDVFAPFVQRPETSLDAIGVGRSDEALIASPSARARLVDMLREAFRQGASGLATDVVSYGAVDWGFDPTLVGVPVTLFYGADDQLVTRAHGVYWRDVLPQAELRDVPGAGHLVPLQAWSDILQPLEGPT